VKSLRRAPSLTGAAAPLPLPIDTPRLRLREFLARDLPAVRRYASDPDVLEHVLREAPTEAQLQQQFERLLRARQARPRRAWELAVVQRRGERLIGTCELVRLGRSEAELGYMLGSRYWRRGYGTEIATALAGAGFSCLPIERMRALVDVGHDSSRRVLEKAGFRWCAHLVRHAHAKQRWWDCDEYELRRAEWAVRRVTPAAR
jgi:RimJ/RimL family protein N-acetyltransferase